jgi:hypothetical protein
MVINFGIEHNVNPLYIDTFTFKKNCIKYSKLPDFGFCLLVAISGNCTCMGFVGGMSKTTFNTEATSPSIVYKGDNHSIKEKRYTKSVSIHDLSPGL